MVHQQVVMKGRFISAPNATIAMLPLVVMRFVQGLTDDAPLHTDVFVVVGRQNLIVALGKAAVINDHMLLPDDRYRILLHLVQIAGPNPQMSNNDLIGLYLQTIALQTNTIPGRCLSRNGNAVVVDV